MPDRSSSYRQGSRPYRPRRSKGYQGRKRSPRGNSSSTTPSRLSFWQKLLQLLGLGPKKASNHSHKQQEGKKRSSISEKKRAPRPSFSEEVTTPRLYIGNLSFDASESDLFELFSGIGTVQNVEIVSHRDTMRSKGFGFVQMTVIEEAKRAIEELHDKEYMGRKLIVSGARDIPDSRKV